MVANRGLAGDSWKPPARPDLVQATRDGALALRMVPVGETFARFQRVVRDTASSWARRSSSWSPGGDTELDKSMVEPSPTR
jgi:two-component system chemotaxis sensor kinase CheA